MKILSLPLKLLLLGLIRLYQLVLSPIYPMRCRFEPTCSVYGREAIEKHGPFVGSVLTIKRICSCHPWGGCGYDPVPEEVTMKSALGCAESKRVCK